MRRLFVSIKGLYMFLDLTSPLNTHALYGCPQVAGSLWWVITRGFSLRKKRKKRKKTFWSFFNFYLLRKSQKIISINLKHNSLRPTVLSILLHANGTLFNDIQLMLLKNILETAFFWLKHGHFIPWLLLSKMIYYSLHLVFALELVLDIW